MYIYKLPSIDDIFSQIGIFLSQQLIHWLQTTELLDDKYFHYLVRQLNKSWEVPTEDIAILN
ncbi:hypothetical protein [Nostoc sp.]|uniref:hypothetical protein n=1 Tax=Nostoc sp. TaxID=1180 RepID=UPI002FF4C5A0